MALLALGCMAGVPAAAVADTAAADPCERASVPRAADGRTVDPRRAATLLFLPGPIRSPEPLLADELLRMDGFAVGMFSPTLGRYSPAQMMLDISQGARVASSLYRPTALASPGVILDPEDGSARIKSWDFLVRRAQDTPGEIEPGLMGSALAAAGRRVAWAGAEGAPHVSAIAAAAGGERGCGRVAHAVTVPERELAARVVGLQRSNDLVVATLPAGGAGIGALKRVAAAQGERLLIVVQAPPDPARTRLMPIAVRGIGGEGGLKSATTRRPGLVVASDVAPTILERLGVDPPPGMQGQPIVAAPRASGHALREMNARLALIAGRRLPFGIGVVLMGGLVLLGALALARIAGHYDEIVRRSRRIVGLAILWLPVLLLVTAALRPSRAVELDIAVGGAFLLGALNDRLIRWPRAPWLPVAAAVAAHGIDFAIFDSYFTGQSLLGSNPLYGARFFGVGNELEAVFVVCGLIGTGALMTGWLGARAAARGFAVAGVALAAFLGLGRIGADVGGVISVGAGFGVAAIYAARARLTPARVALLVALPVLGLALIAGVDALSGGESHLSRTVVRADDAGDLVQVASRRFQASIQGAKGDGVWIVVILAAVALALAWWRRERLFAPLGPDGRHGGDAGRPYRAAITGGAAATVIGALANDSGPAILIIGTVYLAMGLLYLHGRPLPQAPH